MIEKIKEKGERNRSCYRERKNMLLQLFFTLKPLRDWVPKKNLKRQKLWIVFVGLLELLLKGIGISELKLGHLIN